MTTHENPREQVRRSMAALRQSGTGCEQALTSLMQSVLQEAREELEKATDSIAIYRAQGRAQLARDILYHLKHTAQ